MSMRGMVTLAILAASTATAVLPAGAATRHHRRHEVGDLTVTRSRGLPVPPDPYGVPTLNLTGQNGLTTDTVVLPDGSAGDGFGGFQTPDLLSYGLAGGGLTPYQLQ